ncbi:hypothetical protein BLOT_003739 [Blomia tropicalis]|nr:hypothetical protein BLOT_003739 [Blomia tropicalis]
MVTHEHRTAVENGSKAKAPYPKSVIFIISNEFCERFSYYGMRSKLINITNPKAILVLYFRYVLAYSENTATQAFHIFAMACYFTPVLGAIIADSFLGKFWTILSISIVYAIGNIVLSFAAIGGQVALTYVGLGLIALGTGGIKPCVSAFGGDQFLPEQSRELQRFFSLFYVSINAGSLISTFVTPILRQDVTCFGRPDCYPLAFGVPAILMVLAVAFFIVGKFVTNYRITPPQKDNVVVVVVKCIFHALTVKMFKSVPKRSHWLDYADDKFDVKTVNDVKTLMAVLFLYLPLPIFWALFDQQASRWTLQATRMNGQLGGFTIKPDQIQVINPFLVIFMIPVFEYAIYPFMKKIKAFHRPLQRMTIGGLLAALSFIICAIIQLKIEQEQPLALLPSHHHVAIVTDMSCPFTIESNAFNGSVMNKFATFTNVPQDELKRFDAKFIFNSTDSECKSGTIMVQDSWNITKQNGLILFVSKRIFTNSRIDSVTQLPNFLTKPDDGGAMLFTIFNLQNYSPNTTFTVSGKSGDLVPNILSTNDGITFGYLNEFEVEIKGHDIVMSVDWMLRPYHLDQGATYIQLIEGDLNKNVVFTLENVVEKNQLSVFIQLIQYFVITSAEIMFSITGLEFSYSQAPQSMKSVLQACWLLTVAFGNLIVAVIADLKIFNEQSYEFFFFSGLMIIDIAIFAIMAYFYVPFVSDNQSELDNDNEKPFQMEPIKTLKSDDDN